MIGPVHTIEMDITPSEVTLTIPHVLRKEGVEYLCHEANNAVSELEALLVEKDAAITALQAEIAALQPHY